MSEKIRFKFGNLTGFKRISSYIRPYRAGYAVGIIIISISSVLALLITRLWGQLGGVGMMELLGGTDSTGSRVAVSSSESGWMDWLSIDMTSIESVGVAIVAVLVTQAVLSFGKVYLFAHMTEGMMLAMRRDAFRSIISKPMAFYDKKRVGDLNSRVSADITSIQDVFTTTLSELLRQLIIIVGGILALLYFSVTLTLMMLVTLPVMIIAAILFGKFIRKLSKKTQDQVAESNTIVQEALTGIVAVKGYANETLEVGRYASSIAGIKQLAMRGAIWRGTFASFIVLFIFGAITLVIFKGADLMASGGLAHEHFFTFLLMTGMVAGSIGGLAAQFSALQRGLGAIEALMDLIEEPEEAISLEGDTVPTERTRESFTMKDVGFHYPSRPGLAVLKGIDLEIAPGEQVALVGPSGAGKSTISALLLRFHEPTSGAVFVGGQAAAEMELTAYRKRLAFVPQEIILFGGDIRSNIAYGKPSASDAEIEQAAEQAHALEFIRSFPEGFETIVGERGIQLSGGQRQRIAIARAILRNPELLILDEATSALDTTSEFEVQRALDQLMKGRSSLVIAHRLSTVRNADRIAVIEDGRIVESGKHEELMAAKGTYFGLVERQEILGS